MKINRYISIFLFIQKAFIYKLRISYKLLKAWGLNVIHISRFYQIACPT